MNVEELLHAKLHSYNLRQFMNRNESKELCAFLMESGRVVPVRNMAANPWDDWAVTNSQKQDAETDGDKVWAILHTHPFRSQNKPSDYDHVQIGNFLGVMLHVASGKIVLYDRNRVICTDRIAEYQKKHLPKGSKIR